MDAIAIQSASQVVSQYERPPCAAMYLRKVCGLKMCVYSDADYERHVSQGCGQVDDFDDELYLEKKKQGLLEADQMRSSSGPPPAAAPELFLMCQKPLFLKGPK
jgi:hypothetical protein